jgi:hypothetical protein
VVLKATPEIFKPPRRKAWRWRGRSANSPLDAVL